MLASINYLVPFYNGVLGGDLYDRLASITLDYDEARYGMHLIGAYGLSYIPQKIAATALVEVAAY